MSYENTSIVNVREPHGCDGKLFAATTGGVVFTYCCEKGFKKCLEAFAHHVGKTVKPPKQ